MLEYVLFLNFHINKNLTRERKGRTNMNIDYICNQMIRVLHCYICCISDDGVIVKHYGDRADELDPVLTDIVFREKIARKEVKDYPIIFHERGCIFYAVFSTENRIDNSTGKIVVGPVCIEKPNKELDYYMVKEHHISEKAEFCLVHCEMKVFGSAVLMLHHFLTDEELSLNDLWSKNELKERDISEALRSVSSVVFERQEWGIPHNPYDQEIREMDSIRNGDIDKLADSLKETYRGEVGQLSKNQVRQAKNIAICVITLASRAAIDGGMLPEEAFSMVDGYILKIEEMDNAAKIDAMMRQAEFEYAKEVARLKGNRQKNELVERAKNYIFQNLHNDIVISRIASQTGVNASYLSNLFHKTEGVTIQQYIRQEKIRLAENMLRYSEYGVKEIANYLAFCSQSYFGRAFKEQTGMSPINYRKKFGKLFQKEQK